MSGQERNGANLLHGMMPGVMCDETLGLRKRVAPFHVKTVYFKAFLLTAVAFFEPAGVVES